MEVAKPLFSECSTTLLHPDSGYAEIEGLDVVKDYKKIRKILGYMPGNFLCIKI